MLAKLLEKMSERANSDFDLADCVHAWLVPVSFPPPDVQVGMSWLDEYEQDKARRFYCDDDRALYVESHVWLRRILSEVTGVAPQSLRFLRNGNSKPALVRDANTADIEFSLSHTHRCIAIAVSRSRQIGIDVERIRSLESFRDTAGFALNRQERKWLGDLPAHKRDEAFFRVWTVKEAYTKALGLGLARSFDELTVTLHEKERCTVRDEAQGAPAKEGNHFSLAVTLDGEPSGKPYALSVAALGGPVPLVLRQIPRHIGIAQTLDYHDYRLLEPERPVAAHVPFVSPISDHRSARGGVPPD